MKELMDLFRFIEEQGGKVVNLGVSQPGGTGTEPDFMPFDRLATAEEVDSLEEDKIPWSPQEKVAVTEMFKEEPMLEDDKGWPYAIRAITTDNGHVAMVYDLPHDALISNIQRLWPFDNVPDETTLLIDLHSHMKMRLCDMKMIRWHRRNIPVSGDYLHTGGMTIDFIPAEKEDDKVIELNRRKTDEETL